MTRGQRPRGEGQDAEPLFRGRQSVCKVFQVSHLDLGCLAGGTELRTSPQEVLCLLFALSCLAGNQKS